MWNNHNSDVSHLDFHGQALPISGRRRCCCYRRRRRSRRDAGGGAKRIRAPPPLPRRAELTRSMAAEARSLTQVVVAWAAAAMTIHQRHSMEYTSTT